MLYIWSAVLVLHHYSYQLPAFIENFHFTLELFDYLWWVGDWPKCLAETDTSFKWRALFHKRLMVYVISEYFVLGCHKIVLIPYTVSLLKTLRKWLMNTRIMTVTSFIPIKFLIKYANVTLFLRRTWNNFFLFYFSNIWDINCYQEYDKTQGFLAEVGSNLRSITYLWKQCAAVTSHVLLIKVAPHWWMLSYWREACQGQAALGAMTPDAILLTCSGTTRLPQPEKDEIIKL